MLSVDPIDSLDVNDDHVTMRCQRGHNIKAVVADGAREMLHVPFRFRATLQYKDTFHEWRDVPNKILVRTPPLAPLHPPFLYHERLVLKDGLVRRQRTVPTATMDPFGDIHFGTVHVSCIGFLDLQHGGGDKKKSSNLFRLRISVDGQEGQEGETTSEGSSFSLSSGLLEGFSREVFHISSKSLVKQKLRDEPSADELISLERPCEIECCPLPTDPHATQESAMGDTYASFSCVKHRCPPSHGGSMDVASEARREVAEEQHGRSVQQEKDKKQYKMLGKHVQYHKAHAKQGFGNTDLRVGRIRKTALVDLQREIVGLRVEVRELTNAVRMCVRYTHANVHRGSLGSVVRAYAATKRANEH